MYLFRRFVLALWLVFTLGTLVSAQETDPEGLRIEGLLPWGVRTTATEAWSTYQFALVNFANHDRNARVLFFYEGRPDLQFGRDIWVPARSKIVTWMIAGPIPPKLNDNREQQKPPSKKLLASGREIEYLLYDRTDGKDRLLTPRDLEKRRSRMVPYLPRDPYTSIYLDEGLPPFQRYGELPKLLTPPEEAMLLARCFRATRDLSAAVTPVPYGPMPPTPEAFDGLDHFLLASNRISHDPAGMRALRQWVERGGRVWVMLDMMDLENVAPLLSDAIDFQVVDRVRLTSFKVDTHSAMPEAAEIIPAQNHEQPVEFVRVLLPSEERPRHTINGYPLWFTRTLGRGKILFTTLGARGWHRTRQQNDGPSPYPEYFPDLPVPLPHLEIMSTVLQTATQEDSFKVHAFERSLIEEIGYQVPRRSLVGWVFGAFLVGALALGLVLRRVGRAELLSWSLPLAALVVAGVFVILGESSRRQVPPTISLGQIVEALPGVREVSMRGLVAMYRPDSGPAEIGAKQGGIVEVEMKDTAIGQNRRLIVTDTDTWHWENLDLPAGVRLGTFRQTVSTKVPVSVKARFGPEGLEGTLSAGPFRDVEDALIRTVSGWTVGRDMALSFDTDGKFKSGARDILAQKHYLAGTLLSDVQQQRQEMYRAFLDLNKPSAAGSDRDQVGGSLARRAGAPHLEGKNVVLAWTKPIDTHFKLVREARTTGSALLIIPITFERPATGSQVTIPGPFLAPQRVKDGLPLRLTTEGTQDVDMHLRFQLPTEVLPLNLERVRLNFKVEAPSRQLTIAALPEASQEKERIDVHTSMSPVDPIRVDITDARALKLDAQGGLHINLAMRGGDRPVEKKKPGTRGITPDVKWTIQYLELEITGKTAP